MSDHLAMSDEDFLKQPSPGTEAVSSQENFETEPKAETPAETQETQAAESEAKEPITPAAEPVSTGSETKETPAKEDPAEPAPKEGEIPAGSEAEAKPAEGTPAPEAEATPNYEDFYKQMMAPIKANGKIIELKDPKEAIQLIQMGANYTRKLQELAPHRKMMTMLGNHGIDESKLSFFIALDKGDPEAIKKLIVDKGVDPLDIDTKIEPAYQEGSYQVSDQEVAFRTQLEDLTSDDSGKQTLQVINDSWDQASKDMLWQHPEVMPIIHEARENGIYATITAEMDRQKALGQLSPTTPFLQAYHTIGDRLQAAGAFNDIAPQGSANASTTTIVDPAGSAAKPPVTPAVVATGRAATPKAAVDNGDKASAASPSRASPGKAKEAVNFLSMSDDDFLKSDHFKGRL